MVPWSNWEKISDKSNLCMQVISTEERVLITNNQITGASGHNRVILEPPLSTNYTMEVIFEVDYINSEKNSALGIGFLES